MKSRAHGNFCNIDKFDSTTTQSYPFTYPHLLCCLLSPPSLQPSFYYQEFTNELLCNKVFKESKIMM